MVQNRIFNYFERDPQLHVLFVFDPMDMIKSELDNAEWPDDYEYFVFDGAWFNTKYNIENTWKDKKVVLLFSLMACPTTEDDLARFPLLDMLKANKDYKEDDYASFMQQYNIPDRFKGLVSKYVGELTSSKVSGLIKDYYNAESFSEDVVVRGILSSYLGTSKLQEWDSIIVRMVCLGLKSEEKKRTDFFKRVDKKIELKKAVDEKLKQVFGRSYSTSSPLRVKEIAEILKYNSITQLLDVHPFDDYGKLKITQSIALDRMNRVFEFGTHDRMLSQKFVAAMKELASDIQESKIIKYYGIEASYFNMTEDLCWPVLERTIKEKLLTEPGSVRTHMKELSLKFPEDSTVGIAIDFVSEISAYYELVKSLGTLKLKDPESYVQKYLNEFYIIDQRYRHTLEHFHKLVTKGSPIQQTLQETKKQLDIDYAKIVNVFNLEWITCVKEKGEYFDTTSLAKQEDFFANEYDGTIKQVVIISDALRYELAMELMEELASERNMATISAYRAMLPTETKFCKQSLLPHHSLELQGCEMLVDGNTLATLDSRTTHINKYKEDSVCVSYETVMNADQNTNRELFKKPLVYIYHDTIDEAGHSGSPFKAIADCKKAVEELKNLITRLHSSWNVSNVILTSDHGFLYSDIQFQEKDKHSVTDSNIEKKTRYYLTQNPQPVEGITKFPIAKVSGMVSEEDVYVAVPDGTNRLAAAGGYNFAHGGASLQELIIPVIRSNARRVDKTEKVGVALVSHKLNMVSSKLKVQLIQSDTVSMTMKERKIYCRIYDGDNPVTDKFEVSLNSHSEDLNNRVYEITLSLTKPVLSSMLQFRVFDLEDKDELNPLIKETVTNNTLIEQDF